MDSFGDMQARVDQDIDASVIKVHEGLVKHFGDKLPDDVVWNVAPLLFIRIYSVTSWNNISRAVRDAEKADKHDVNKAIDRALVILSRQDRRLALLPNLSFNATDATEKDVIEFFHLIDSLPGTAIGRELFVRVYLDLVQNIAEGRSGAHVSADALDVAFGLIKTKGFKGKLMLYSACIGGPEFLTCASRDLGNKQIVAQDLDFQNELFCDLAGFLNGWPMNVTGASALARDAVPSKPLFRNTLTVVPDEGPTKPWVEKTLEHARPDGTSLFIIPDTLLQAKGADEKKWRTDMAKAGRVEAIVKLPADMSGRGTGVSIIAIGPERDIAAAMTFTYDASGMESRVEGSDVAHLANPDKRAISHAYRAFIKGEANDDAHASQKTPDQVAKSFVL